MVSIYSCSIKITVDKQLTLSILILGQSYMYLFLPYLKYVKHQSFNLSDVLCCISKLIFPSGTVVLFIKAMNINSLGSHGHLWCIVSLHPIKKTFLIAVIKIPVLRK